ncbi:hypothetical protein F4805DRAFT_93813 [Annulohypoxylon moriforme]|nr:hypothetical protein F4805DRAFT_93813 [Annulohypoxylon moriforme]
MPCPSWPHTKRTRLILRILSASLRVFSSARLAVFHRRLRPLNHHRFIFRLPTTLFTFVIFIIVLIALFVGLFAIAFALRHSPPYARDGASKIWVLVGHVECSVKGRWDYSGSENWIVGTLSGVCVGIT